MLSNKHVLQVCQVQDLPAVLVVSCKDNSEI